MPCWWLMCFRKRGDHTVHFVFVLPNAAIASIRAWWQTCPVQASACSSSCMCANSSVILLTAAAKSLRNGFLLLWSRGHASRFVCVLPFNLLGWQPVESSVHDWAPNWPFEHRQPPSFAVLWPFLLRLWERCLSWV